MATKDYSEYLDNPNVQQTLRAINKLEGSPGYDQAFGYKPIKDLSSHPGTTQAFKDSSGKLNRTSAAGAYQFIKPTWERLSAKTGVPDFSQRSQDINAVALLDDRGALQDAVDGNYNNVISKMGVEFASFPTSPYNQPKKTWEQARAAFEIPAPATTAEPEQATYETGQPEKSSVDLLFGSAEPMMQGLDVDRLGGDRLSGGFGDPKPVQDEDIDMKLKVSDIVDEVFSA